MIKDYERIDELRKDMDYMQNVSWGNTKKLEALLREYGELLKVFEDTILTFIKRDIEENGVRDNTSST